MTTARIRQKNHSRFHQFMTEDLLGEVSQIGPMSFRQPLTVFSSVLPWPVPLSSEREDTGKYNLVKRDGFAFLTHLFLIISSLDTGRSPIDCLRLLLAQVAAFIASQSGLATDYSWVGLRELKKI